MRSRRSPGRWGIGLFATLLVMGATACSELAGESPLAQARRSPEALARAALDALRQGYDEELAGLMVTRQEYEEMIWPSLPDREYVPFDFVWSVTGPRSRKARKNLLEDYRGIPMELVRVEPGEEVEAYGSFTLHRGARMTVRRTDTGEEGVLPLMDVLVEMEGGWKFMNFRDHA